jgi:hypothetical protein
MVFLRRFQFSYLPVRADGTQGSWAHRCQPPRTIGCCSLSTPSHHWILLFSLPLYLWACVLPKERHRMTYRPGGLDLSLTRAHLFHASLAGVSTNPLYPPPCGAVLSTVQTQLWRACTGHHSMSLVGIAAEKSSRVSCAGNASPRATVPQVSEGKHKDSDRFVLTCARAHSRSMRDIERCTVSLTCAHVFTRVITHECAHARVPSNFLAGVPLVRTG